MEKVVFLFSVHNRLNLTKSFFSKILTNNKNLQYLFEYIVVDDGSSDGTFEYFKNIKNKKIHIVRGNGQLFWSGAMKFGYHKILKKLKYDYLICCNDDILVKSNIYKLFLDNIKKNDVLVGQFANSQGKLVYGGLKKRKYFPFSFNLSSENIDTFNMNFVSFKKSIIERYGFFDDNYRHSKSDIDYGLKLKKNRVNITVFPKILGICERASPTNEFSYSKISFYKFITNPKYHPLKERFEFCMRNFKLNCIFCFLFPYINFIIRKFQS